MGALPPQWRRGALQTREIQLLLPGLIGPSLPTRPTPFGHHVCVSLPPGHTRGCELGRGWFNASEGKGSSQEAQETEKSRVWSWTVRPRPFVKMWKCSRASGPRFPAQAFMLPHRP